MYVVSYLMTASIFLHDENISVERLDDSCMDIVGAVKHGP